MASVPLVDQGVPPALVAYALGFLPTQELLRAVASVSWACRRFVASWVLTRDIEALLTAESSVVVAPSTGNGDADDHAVVVVVGEASSPQDSSEHARVVSSRARAGCKLLNCTSLAAAAAPSATELWTHAGFAPDQWLHGALTRGGGPLSARILMLHKGSAVAGVIRWWFDAVATAGGRGGEPTGAGADDGAAAEKHCPPLVRLWRESCLTLQDHGADALTADAAAELYGFGSFDVYVDVADETHTDVDVRTAVRSAARTLLGLANDQTDTQRDGDTEMVQRCVVAGVETMLHAQQLPRRLHTPSGAAVMFGAMGPWPECIADGLTRQDVKVPVTAIARRRAVTETARQAQAKPAEEAIESAVTLASCRAPSAKSLVLVCPDACFWRSSAGDRDQKATREAQEEPMPVTLWYSGRRQMPGHGLRRATVEEVIVRYRHLVRVPPQQRWAPNVRVVDLSECRLLATIGACAFKACFSLEAVNLPPSVRCIGAYLCFGCGALTTFRLGCASQLEYYPAHAFIATGNFCRDAALPKSALVVPRRHLSSSRVEHIDLSQHRALLRLRAHALAYTRSVRKIHLPPSVRHIGRNVLEGAALLSRVDLGALRDLVDIGPNAFCRCLLLAHVRLPTASLRSIGDHVLDHGSKSITIEFAVCVEANANAAAMNRRRRRRSSSAMNDSDPVRATRYPLRHVAQTFGGRSLPNFLDGGRHMELKPRCEIRCPPELQRLLNESIGGREGVCIVSPPEGP